MEVPASGCYGLGSRDATKRYSLALEDTELVLTDNLHICERIVGP